MRENWFRSLLCTVTAAAVLTSACRTPQPQKVAKPVVSWSSPASIAATKTTRAHVAIDASAGEDGKLTATLASAAIVSTDAVVTTLGAQETQALLARMEPLPSIDNTRAPTIRPASQPPPRSGPVTPIAFVAPAGKDVADKPISIAPAIGVPLQPPQVLPVGEVDREAEIRVRFDEPMIPVAAVGNAAMLSIAIKPNVAGTWRWIDTRGAQFTAQAPRLPGGTDYTVTVAAGAKAVSGATLMSPLESTFSTPPVRIAGTYPTVQLRPDSVIAVKFDQAVDSKAIEKFLRVEHGKKKLAFQLTTLAVARAA